MSSLSIPHSSVEINTGEQTKNYNQRGKNNHESDVGSQGTHEVNETHETHEDEEKGKGGIETFGGETGRDWGGSCRCVGAVGVVKGLECGGKGEPEGAEGHEDDEREGVANYEFQEATDEHEEATEEEVCSAVVKGCL